MSEQEFRVLDLEGKLAEDKTGDFLNELTQAIDTESHDVRNQMSKGLTPDEFRSFESYANGLETARLVVTRVWDRAHLNSQ